MTQLHEPQPPPGEPTDPPWEPPEDPGLATYAQNGTGSHLNGHPVSTSRDPGGSTRTPPQDILAEQSVLGAMLISTQAIDDVESELDPSDFYRPAHEDIYHAILTLHATGAPADMVTVAGHLAAQPAPGRRGRTLLEHVGGHDYIHDLATAVPTAANATYYASIVRNHARLRAVVDTGTRLTQLGYAADIDRVDTYLGEALQTLDNTVQRFGPRLDGPGVGNGLADLSWVSTGQEPRQPAPVYVRRDDGTSLFYAGKVNGVFGDPEHGKTWLAQLAIVQALNEGRTAAMIDVDHNGPQATAGRLFLLGAELDAISDPERFRYYEPEDGEELLNAVTDITTRAMDVTVLDSLGEIFPMLGVKTNDGDEITTAMRQVLTRPALAGSCVITIDHLPKSNEARTTGFAIGSIAKKRMIRGAYIRADAKIKPTPGQIGRIALRIEKDSSGELRRSSGGGYAGTLILDSTDDRYLTWHIGRDVAPTNEDGTLRPTTLMERVAAYVGDHEGCTQRDIETDIQGTAKWIRQALQVLVNEGHISRAPGKQRRFHHHLEIPYREAEDDRANTA